MNVRDSVRMWGLGVSRQLDLLEEQGEFVLELDIADSNLVG